MNALTRNRARGFSLIEVLIAVIVLSFGLLALAALQARLIQSSSEAKAQSVALALAKDKIEELRAYRTLAPTTNCTANPDSYRCIDSSATPETLADTSGSLGGVNFTRSWTVRRYAVTTTGTNFTQLATANNTSALPAGYVQNNEFKTIDVRVSWTDAQGQTRTVAMEDAIAGLDPQDSARNQRNRGMQPRGPEVLIYDPSGEAGVIPIAIGSGSSTAATNPKPVNVARTGDDAVETRFDVLTYAALSGGKALAQARVETTVVGCTCRNSSASSPGYRPTYWNGYRYVAPQRTVGNAPAQEASNVTQSRYCDACCRDHHDTGFSGAKFSPRRAVHTHYKLQSGSLVPAGANDNYLEACRLIRVDGIFDVAADLSNDYFNLLETASSADSYVPSANGVSSYQDFVLDYLHARYVSPNPGGGSQSAVYNNRTTPSPATYAAAAQPQSLDAPAEISIDPVAGLKWLHSRGLYMDFLEQEALDAISDAKANCQGTGTSPPTAAQLRECVLKTLPFTSINLSEISEWTPLAGTQIRLDNGIVPNFDAAANSSDPVRGRVTPGTAPVNNSTENAIARVTAGNSGVAISGDIDPDDAASVLTDLQVFRISNSGTGGGSGATFNVSVAAPYPILSSDPPDIGFTYNSDARSCSATSGGNPFVCATLSTQPLPAAFAIPVRVSDYNRNSPTPDTISNPCRNNATTPMPYRLVYDVASITSSNPSAVIGALQVTRNHLVGATTGEVTSATVTPINPNDALTITMSAVTYRCPVNNPAGGSSEAYFQCSGSGVNAAPNWDWGSDGTGVVCPAGQGGGGTTPPNFPQ
jgi:type IV pilus modification protein PilV